jgi:hypothetical protein
MSVVFCQCNVFLLIEFRFPWNYNKSTAFTSKQHSLFVSHGGFHKNKEFFDDHIISRNAEIPWPPRSCDLTPCGFFLWLYLKNCVFQTPVANLVNLQ